LLVISCVYKTNLNLPYLTLAKFTSLLMNLYKVLWSFNEHESNVYDWCFFKLPNIPEHANPTAKILLVLLAK